MDSAPAGLVVCEPTGVDCEPRGTPERARTPGNAAAARGLVSCCGPEELRAAVGSGSHREEHPPLGPAREDFRVVAFLPTYNESDLISHTLQYLTGQGIQVYLIDNWSTDDTLARARRFSGRGLIGMERFPSDGPVATYEWRQILGRVEDIAEQLDADWFVLHDADERRHTPWPGVDLRTGLHPSIAVASPASICGRELLADRRGIRSRSRRGGSAQVIQLQRPSGPLPPARSLEELWLSCLAGRLSGHNVRFPGRRVYPFKFLLKHYPIRSEEHGRRKVLGDRAPRWNPDERALGWHRQYEDVMTADTFLRDPATLQFFEEAQFAESTSSSGCRPSASSTPDQFGPPDPVTRIEWVRADRL